MRAIGSTPDEPYSQIYATLISAISSAETRDPAHQRLLRSRPAADAGADRRRRARRRRQADPAEHDRLVAGLPRRAARHYEPLLRGGVKIYERREAPAARQDRGDRRRLVDGRLDQPRLAQLPAQRGDDRRRPRRRISATRCAPRSSATSPPRTRSRSSVGSAGRSARAPRKCSLDCGSIGYELSSFFASRAACRLPRRWRWPSASSRPRAAQDAAALRARFDVAAGQVREQPVRPAARARVDADLRRPEGRRLRARRPPFRDGAAGAAIGTITGATS